MYYKMWGNKKEISRNRIIDSSYVQSIYKKRERNAPIYFNTNYRTEMKLVNEIVKFTSQITWKEIFTTFQTLVRELLDVGIIANASFLEESFSS